MIFTNDDSNKSITTKSNTKLEKRTTFVTVSTRYEEKLVHKLVLIK